MEPSGRALGPGRVALRHSVAIRHLGWGEELSDLGLVVRWYERSLEAAASDHHRPGWKASGLDSQLAASSYQSVYSAPAALDISRSTALHSCDGLCEDPVLHLSDCLSPRGLVLRIAEL